MSYKMQRGIILFLHYSFWEANEMKKKIISLLTIFVMLFAFSMTAYAESAQDVPDKPIMPDRYNYTSYLTCTISISGSTATCCSNVVGYSSMVTKIGLTQSLEELLTNGWWRSLQSWSKTFYDWYAIYTTTGTIPHSGTYRTRTLAKVYSGSNYETIEITSRSKTV